MFDAVVVVVEDAEDTNSDDFPLLLPMLPPLVLELMPPPRPSKFMELFVDVPAPDNVSKLLAKEADESFKMLLLPLSPLLLLLVACGSSVPKPPPRLLASCNLPNGPPGKELVVAADVLRF